jgi:hypothetical protein
LYAVFEPTNVSIFVKSTNSAVHTDILTPLILLTRLIRLTSLDVPALLAVLILLLSIRGKREEVWPPRLAAYGEGFLAVPFNLFDDAHTDFESPYGGTARFGGVKNLQENCVVKRHRKTDATAHENKAGGLNNRMCQNLRPYFPFAKNYAVPCTTIFAGDELDTNWGWACAKGGSVMRTNVMMSGERMYASAVVDFPNKCSIAVRTTSRCMEAPRCQYPEGFSPLDVRNYQP